MTTGDFSASLSALHAPTDPVDGVRQEIAAHAARLIAEDGLDYASAKRKAARQLLGPTKIHGDFMPNNDEITEELRIYQQLFQSETQPAHLAQLRATALELMRLLAEYQPVLVGAVLNGTAGEHTDIHLNLYTSNEKDVEIFLLNQDIDFEANESVSGPGRMRVETLSFMWSPLPRRRDLAEGVHLHILPEKAARPPLTERAGIADLERLIAAAQSEAP